MSVPQRFLAEKTCWKKVVKKCFISKSQILQQVSSRSPLNRTAAQYYLTQWTTHFFNKFKLDSPRPIMVVMLLLCKNVEDSSGLVMKTLPFFFLPLVARKRPLVFTCHNLKSMMQSINCNMPWLSISIALTIIGICISEDPIILSADYVLPCYVFILLCFKTRFVKLHQLFRKDPFFGLLCLSVYQHADWSCTYALLLGCTTSQAKKLPTYSHGLLKKTSIVFFPVFIILVGIFRVRTVVWWENGCF